MLPKKKDKKDAPVEKQEEHNINFPALFPEELISTETEEEIDKDPDIIPDDDNFDTVPYEKPEPGEGP